MEHRPDVKTCTNSIRYLLQRNLVEIAVGRWLLLEIVQFSLCCTRPFIQTSLGSLEAQHEGICQRPPPVAARKVIFSRWASPRGVFATLPCCSSCACLSRFSTAASRYIVLPLACAHNLLLQFRKYHCLGPSNSISPLELIHLNAIRSFCPACQLEDIVGGNVPCTGAMGL